MRLHDPALVRRQYRSEAGLAARREAQTRFQEGPDALDEAFAVVAEVAPRRVLEVGCGMGQFAERMAGKLPAEVVAVDLSPRMVELSRERGVEAQVADVQALPFSDGEFDCVVANFMLYHVGDVGRALAELARVLRAGGRLVATTLRADHMADLWKLVGFVLPERSFSGENGEEKLRSRFTRIELRDVEGSLVFPDAAAVRNYVDSSFFADAVPRPLPDFNGTFRSRTSVSIFVAER